MSKSKCLVSFSLPHHGEGKPFYPPPPPAPTNPQNLKSEILVAQVAGCQEVQNETLILHPGFAKIVCMHILMCVCAFKLTLPIYIYIYISHCILLKNRPKISKTCWEPQADVRSTKTLFHVLPVDFVVGQQALSLTTLLISTFQLNDFL